jgi:hypothetical protein
MRYIVLGMRPLSTIEDENFIKIIKVNYYSITNIKNVKIISVNTTSLIYLGTDYDFIKVVEKIKNLFTTEPLAIITTTADIWSTIWFCALTQ